MLKLEVIMEVHQLKRQGFKVAAIARKCNLSRTTVYEYIEKDFELIKNQFLSLIPTAHRKDTISLGQQMDKVLKSFLRGHLLVALFVGALTAIGLTLVKMEFALVIGMIAGL